MTASSRALPHRSAAFGLTSLVAGFLAVMQVAPLSAQAVKSLVDLLTSPKAEEMPALVRASSDGAMLAGRLIVEAVPRLTLAPHVGDKLAPVDPQRLAAASPDIAAPAQIEAMRLASHFLTTENAADRAALEAIFAGKVPDYFKNIESAANAPKVGLTKPAPLTDYSGAADALSTPGAEAILAAQPLADLTGLGKPDGLKLPKGYLVLPPPPPPPVEIKPMTLPVVEPDLPVLAALPAGPGLEAVQPPKLDGKALDPNNPDDRPVIDAILGTTTPVQPTDPQLPAVVELTGKDLNKAVQTELKRLNCMTGKADGNFGKGSQGALDLFYQTTGLTHVSGDISMAVLGQLQATDDNACPSPFAAKPVADATPTKPVVTKPATTKPATTKPATTKPVATKPATPAKPAKPSTDPCVKDPASCMSFN